MYIKNIVRRIIKQVWGIDGISIFIQKNRKKLFKRLYRKKYSADDIICVMTKMGMKEGSVVFVHSAMTEFYNYTGDPVELIEKIIEKIGPEGTLMMPAYPKKKGELFKEASETENIVFDINKTCSGAGLLTEVFRKYPNVKRSINLQHSVCGYGKLANYFLNEHQLSEFAWDSHSPYYKLTQMDALIFCIGLESYLRNVTIIHCVETLLKDKYSYFSSFFGKKLEYRYLDVEGKIGVHKMILPIKTGVRSKHVIKHHFDRKYLKRFRLSNLLIESVDSRYMFNKCLELVENGISIYSSPSYKNHMENGKFIKIDHSDIID